MRLQGGGPPCGHRPATQQPQPSALAGSSTPRPTWPPAPPSSSPMLLLLLLAVQRRVRPRTGSRGVAPLPRAASTSRSRQAWTLAGQGDGEEGADNAHARWVAWSRRQGQPQVQPAHGGALLLLLQPPRTHTLLLRGTQPVTPAKHAQPHARAHWCSTRRRAGPRRRRSTRCWTPSWRNRCRRATRDS